MVEGREHEAVANARQRLALQKQAVGERHPDYATGLNQLALLLIMHNDPDQAEPLLREALDIRKDALGEKHPDYATNLSSLAGLLWARGDLDAAEPLLRKALEVRWEVLGGSHPKSVASLNSLEQLLRAKQDWAGIERLQGINPATGQIPAVEPTSGRTEVPEPRAETEAVAAAPEFEPTREVPAEPEPIPVQTPVEEQVPVAAEPSPASPLPEAHTFKAEPAPGVAPLAFEEGSARAALSRRLETLSGVFGRVGERLAAEAEQWKRGGAPPSEGLVAELSECSRDFEGLRADVERLAESLGDPEAGRNLADLQAISAALEVLGELEARTAQIEAVRGMARDILDLVLSLANPDQPEYPPLVACQSKARELKRTIAEASGHELPPEATALAEGDHPFNGLLTLVEGTEGLSDDLWANSLESVEREFGKPLSVAVARGKIVLPAGGS